MKWLVSLLIALEDKAKVPDCSSSGNSTCSMTTYAGVCSANHTRPGGMASGYQHMRKGKISASILDPRTC